VKNLKQRHPALVEQGQGLSADKGYDSELNNRKLWRDHRVKPHIDIRSIWKEKETRLIDDTWADNIVYDEADQIFCHCPLTDEPREMAYRGFEADRESLKYRCPAAAYGFQCQGRSQCGTGHYSEYGRVVRIPLEKNPRIFTPIARSSYDWHRGYKRRTAVERANSRLDTSFTSAAKKWSCEWDWPC